MRCAGWLLLTLIAFLACPTGSSSEARADLIVADDGMSCTSESGPLPPQESNPVVSPDLHDLLMLVLFNSDKDVSLSHHSAGGASGACTGTVSMEHGPTPQGALFSQYGIRLSQMVLLQVSESSVFTPQTLISGIFRPPRNAT